MSSRLEDIEFRNQRAIALVVDMALLLEAAEAERTKWLGRACARASIINAALLLECTANSCIFSLGLPGKLIEELDRLPALSKLDYFLFATSGNHIDRGCREVELVAEVIRLRDHVVHPKPKSGRLVRDQDRPFVDYGATKSLAIPFDVLKWDHQSAGHISTVVFNFLKKYFLEWYALSKGRVTTLLVVREKALIQGTTESWVEMLEPELAVVKQWTPGVLEILDLRSRGGGQG
jgi:hypothetical protein